MKKSEILTAFIPLVLQAHEKKVNVDLDLTNRKVAIYYFNEDGKIEMNIEIWNDDTPQLKKAKFDKAILKLKTLTL